MKHLDKTKLIGKYFWIAIIVLVVLAAGLMGALLPRRAQGTVAIVYVGGDKVAELQLNDDTVKVYPYGHVLLAWGQGKVTVLECDKGRMCRHGEESISRVGESIICPLNQVVVEVK